MRFWDSSALVPLCLQQPRTAEAVAALRADREMTVWWASPVECASAIARLHRDGHLGGKEEREARALLDELSRSWFEIRLGDAIREQAMRLLRIHTLRAADALQLAAALEWSGSPASGAFVTFDDRLLEVALREGFSAS